jgi:hypothetical protein
MKILLALLFFSVAATWPAVAFVVQVEAQVEGDTSKPVISGKTNLPKGTKLIITVERKAISYKAQSPITVRDDGAFRSEAFTLKGAPLSPGNYEFEVLMPVSAGQPEDVRALIGLRGENISGPLVKPWTQLGKIVEMRASFKVGR